MIYFKLSDIDSKLPVYTDDTMATEIKDKTTGLELILQNKFILEPVPLNKPKNYNPKMVLKYEVYFQVLELREGKAHIALGFTEAATYTGWIRYLALFTSSSHITRLMDYPKRKYYFCSTNTLFYTDLTFGTESATFVKPAYGIVEALDVDFYDRVVRIKHPLGGSVYVHYEQLEPVRHDVYRVVKDIDYYIDTSVHGTRLGVAHTDELLIGYDTLQRGLITWLCHSRGYSIAAYYGGNFIVKV